MKSETAITLIDTSLGSPGVDITFQELSYTIKYEDHSQGFKLPCFKRFLQKRVLNKVSGIFKSGEVTAIMGASGAGKTSLLNVLACKVPQKNMEGIILANGKQYTFKDLGDFANYVMQTDVLMQTLTVRETLEFAANLKLSVDEDQRKDRISTLCRQLKLEKCLDVLVGGPVLKGISGGQRKRTSIAFELLSDPQVLILDEPTSGLDSLTSFIIVRYLKRLAEKEGKTIIMTIHQPNNEIFALFDRLFLLVDGQFIYQGPRSNAIDYFKNEFDLECPLLHNPADYFLSIMHHSEEKNLERYPKYFAKYALNIKPDVELLIRERRTNNIEARTVKVDLLRTYSTLLKRDYINIVRNPLLLKSRLVQTLIISIFAGVLYYGFQKDYTTQLSWRRYAGFFFYIAINMFMISIVPVTLVYPTQREIFLKEEGAKLYGVGAYFLSRNIIEIPYSIVFPLIQCLIMYWFIGLQSSVEQFFTFYLISYLLSFNGMSLGLMLGSLVTDYKLVSAVTPVVLLPGILFSGFFKNTDNLSDWIGWTSYISPVKHGFSAFIQNEVLHTAESRIATLKLDMGLWPSIGALVGLGIGFHLISLFFLWLLRDRPS